jgi:hypothetical protein
MDAEDETALQVIGRQRQVRPEPGKLTSTGDETRFLPPPHSILKRPSRHIRPSLQVINARQSLDILNGTLPHNSPMLQITQYLRGSHRVHHCL